MRLRPFLTLLCLTAFMAGQALMAAPPKRAEKTESRRKTTVRKADRKAPTDRKAPANRKALADRKGQKSTARGAKGMPAVKEARSGRKTGESIAKPKVAAKPAAVPAAAEKPATKTSLTESPSTPARAVPTGDLVAQADLAYRQKSFAAALRGYRSALVKKAVPDSRRPQVEFRVARSLAMTYQWDSATQEMARFASRNAGTAWDARARGWLMQLYLMVPHDAWKVGDRFYRGQDIPEVTDAAQPERVDLTEEDQRKALLYGEQARQLWEKLRPKEGPATEEADHAADLARVVSHLRIKEWARALQWKPPSDEGWKLDGAYDPAWAPPKRVLYLLLHAERVGDAERKPLARLAQAVWLRGYQRMMNYTAYRREPGKEPVKVPYPYQDRTAAEVLRSLTAEFPKHPEAEHAPVMTADWLYQDGKLDEALAAYEAFLKDRPKSKWAVNAMAGIESITRLQLSVTPPAPQPPGKKVKLTVSAANVPVVKWTAYRVKLEELVRDPRVVSVPKDGLGDLITRLGKTKGLRKFQQGEPVTWESKLSREGDHNPVDTEVETPLIRVGAYVVEANGGPVRSTLLVVISDLAVIQMVERDRVHAMVVNAATGAPVSDATLVIREIYTAWKEGKEKRLVSAARVTSNADGLAEKPLVKERTSSPDILTFAWKGDRYAFTGSGSEWPASFRFGHFAHEAGKVYVYTDRPVYRPGQTVHYRALLAKLDGDGKLTPGKGAKATIIIRDTRSGELVKREAVAGDFGSVSGRFSLPASVPLGECSLVVAFGEGEAETQETVHFAVEEYKKPEFEVTVVPGNEAARVGEPLTAKIVARYYFGSPVAMAKVTYRVQRSELFPRSPFTGKYDFLYKSLNDPEAEGSSRWWSPGWEPIPDDNVVRGTAVTNDKGEVTLKFPTALADPRFAGRHLQFAIHAEVADASRRTIVGEGTARALATGFNAFLQVRQGFSSVGDRLQADVRTLDADERPVSVAGTARVLRLTPGEGEKVREEEVYRTPLRTDAEGRALFQWTADQDGHFEVRFEARDGREQLVVGRSEAWIAGEAAGAGVLHNRHVTLVPERLTYRVGEKARVLLVSDEPGLSVLLTYEAGVRILEKRVIRLTGRSTVLEIPLTRRESPDVILSVTGVRNRQLFRSRCTLYVPPAEELLDVQVTADKAIYRPGETAEWRIRARDVNGRAVRTEASLGVVDASLFYISGDNALPIAPFFYASERGSQVDPEQSLETVLEALQENDVRRNAIEPVSWRFPEGLGLITANPSEIIDLDGRQSGRRNPFAPTPELGLLQLLDASGQQAPPADSAGEVARSHYYTEVKPRSRGKESALQANSPSPRTNFADTAFWTPSVVTDANGEAVVRFRWPDNLTRWRATTRAWGAGAEVGEATADVETTKDLLVRLQSPRFFTERDEVTLSANVHNYTASAKSVRVRLELDGDLLVPASQGSSGPPQPRALDIPRADLPAGSPSENLPSPPSIGGPGGPLAGGPLPQTVLESTVAIPAGEERRLDWRLRAERAGPVRVRVIADAGSGPDGPISDAVEHQFPVLVHGVEKLAVKSGSLAARADGKPRTAKLSLDLPLERAPESGELIVSVSPSIAGTVLDALPYLVDYPYGCVEQTLNRFVPAVVAARTLTDLGVDLPALRKRAQAEHQRLLLERPADRLANSAYSYPVDAPGRRDADRLQRERIAWHAEKNPLFSQQELSRITRDGLDRLTQAQNADGGWGWWQNDASDAYLSALVLQGLMMAKGAGGSAVAVPGSVLQKGFAYLQAQFRKESGRNNRTFQGYVLTLDPKRRADAGSALLATVYPQREGLSPHGVALLALALKASGHAAEAKTCVDNLDNTARVDAASGTCSWPKTGSWWEWYRNEVETASVCLRAYIAVQPKHRNVPMIVRWLVNNRSGNEWDSTRETALAIQALTEFMRATGEAAPDGTVTVEVAGRFKRSFTLTPESALLGDHRVIVPASALESGSVPVTVTREGKGSLYYSASLRYFTLEEGITATGNEIRVRRRYYRLVKPDKPEAGAKPVAADADGFQRVLLRPGERITSGEQLEAELLIESKNNYSYLVFEDMKPAGCEPVELRSGSVYGDGLCSNMELRDEKVAFFITNLPQGKRRITYRLRAEVPGLFHALPVNGYAMYAPEIRCVSDEGLLGIQDGPAIAARTSLDRMAPPSRRMPQPSDAFATRGRSGR